MVFADAGIGKSMFVLSVALAIAGGGTLFGRWTNQTPRRVLIVDGEMDTRDFQERSRMLQSAVQGLNWPLAKENIDVMARLDQPGGDFINIAEPAGREAVVRAARLHRAELVILDNYSTLAEVEDENTSASFDGVQNLMLDLKGMGCCVILVHHTNKSGGFRGTSKMTAVMNTTVKLARPSGSSGSEGTHFTLTFEKFRGRRDVTTAGDFTAKLTSGNDTVTNWSVQNAESDVVVRAVELNRSGDYPSEMAIAKAMMVDRSTVGRYRLKAISQNLITANEWMNNIQIAKRREKDGDLCVQVSPFREAPFDYGDDVL